MGQGGRKPIESEGRRVETYGAGRVCGDDGCSAVLSIYNETDHCALHRKRTNVPQRGVRRNKKASA